MKKKLLLTLPTIFLLASCGAENENEASNEDVAESAESSINAEGMPISDEKIEMTYFAMKSPANGTVDWNDHVFWKEYEEMTNIHIEFDEYLLDAVEEQRNLSLVSGNLPDVYYSAGFPISDIFRYGSQGVFQPLNDYIEEYAPNLTAIMEENPEVRQAITYPDGNIYSLPGLIDEDFVSVRIGARPWVDTELLDELNLEIPETLDEFYEFLVAVKDSDDSKIPYGGTNIGELFNYVAGSYGLMNRGNRNGPIDLDEETNQLRFYPTTNEYREALEFMNKLDSEGLIDQNIFTIEWNQFLANASDDQYASYIFYDPVDLFGGEVGEKYTGMTALEGPDGEQMYVNVAPMVNSLGNYLITESNEHPEAAVRWLDYFYGDEGSKFYFMGREGDTHEIVDGEIEYVESILNPEDGKTFQQELSQHLTWIGQNQGILTEDYFRGSESAPKSIEAAEKIEPYIPEIWSTFFYTEEENSELLSNGVDIEQYVTESRDRFITGDLSLDEWDNYVSTLENMNLEGYMSIKQDAYERYINQ